MNAIGFGAKRVFHGFLRVTRKALAALGLTAARFDMLSAVLEHDWKPVGPPQVLQSELRRELGVSAPVVSRMLRALEELGWVRREKAHGGEDRRQRWVLLTELGEAVIREAQKLIVRGVRRLVYEAICFGKHRDPGARFTHMDRLESYLRVLRREFGDTATLYYPWGHPDD
jgi:DNA-binding MarR family transcriptional regulator